MLPPVQVSTPEFGMTRLPSPVRVPLLMFSAAVCDVAAIDSVPPEIVGDPWLVRLLMELGPVDKMGEPPGGMHTLSDVPGSTVGFQLAAVCQSVLTAPVQVTLQLPAVPGVFVGVAVGVNVGVGVSVEVGVIVGV